MLAALPLLSFCILALGFRRRSVAFRESLVFASIPCALFLVFLTEGCSAFHLISRPALATGWLIFALAGAAWTRSIPATAASHPAQPISSLSLADKLALGGVTLLVLLIALTAWMSAPNNWDAMEYHMPRIVEWISGHGVQLYPTIDRQQLSMPPFFEYAALHLNLLYGSDRLVNFVQWSAYIGCLLIVSLITQWLGGERRIQVFAVVLTATLPTAILGASSAKNDCVLSFWIALSVYLCLLWKSRQSWPLTLAIASTLGLAIFTKGTAYAFLPFLILACAATWDRAGWSRFLLRLPVVALVIAAINAPLWLRNYRFSGSILGLPYFDGAGPDSARMFGNAHITMARSLANAIRSIGLNMGVPSHGINHLLTAVLSRCIQILGVNPNDPSQIVIGQSGLFRPFAVAFASRNEALAGNPFHFYLWIAAILVCLFAFRKVRSDVRWMGAGLVAAFFLYAALLRWSPFNARYQLPVFALSSVFIALVLGRALPRAAVAGIMFLLLVVALPAALANQARPLLTKPRLQSSILTASRDETYFFDEHQNLTQSYLSAAHAVAAGECRDIGVDANLLHFEYPLFALLEKYAKPRTITYVGVTNPTESYRSGLAPAPCTIVCLGCAGSAEKLAQYSSGRNATSFDSVVVFAPIDAAHDSGSKDR